MIELLAEDASVNVTLNGAVPDSGVPVKSAMTYVPPLTSSTRPMFGVADPQVMPSPTSQEMAVSRVMMPVA